ncbi:speckle targeted PIP5K1A-regulated poly(A) polymerase-like isoform X2 [Belonocnema kinseyi]|uniref:speckle targeted PIP5K1A-regulated poly(A) polymerase-like isoform X2 n=1 Tax=Belonocnema kinseyi TaxID=2817044 RepID=UPI00143D2DDF|nr:speckle targeted PIP5K1A-regulated poly(A) polymerase-like isoform X2 [Belonocnema kinseyi]
MFTAVYFVKPVDILLNAKSLQLHGTRLEVKPRTVYQNNSVPKNNNKAHVEGMKKQESETSFEHLKPIFEQGNGFDDQLSSFLNAIALSQTEIETLYESVCVNLNRLFQQSFPKCKTNRFGSTVTELGFKNCDLDIYVDIGEPLSNDDDRRPYVWTLKKVFGEAKRLLFRKPNMFNKVIPIPKAKTPIIKFCNVSTNISCDLSFRNSLGVHNSLLIKHYLSLDVRLKPLMLVIKYWAKHCDISTETRGGRITNYALAMLFIFYLQQTNVSLVPPVIDLKRTCQPKIIEGWQVNFDKTLRHPLSDKKSTIPELLHGFFKFYANFNFKQNVICPVDGNVYSKDIFKDVNSLPESMHRYKDYVNKSGNNFQLNVQKPMCIQDPTELNHNFTANVSDILLAIFQKHCSVSAEVCQNALKSSCSQLLLNLFTIMPEVTKSKAKKVVIQVPMRNFQVGLPVDFDTRTDISDKEQFIRENWYNVVFNIVKGTFEMVFKLKVSITLVNREQKQQKMEVESDVHTADNQKIVLHCTGNRCLWKNRKCKLLALDPSYSALEKEVIISDTILKNSKQITENKINLNLNCIFEKKQNPPHVIISLNDNDSGKLFAEFANFFRGKMPSIIEKTLLHMVQYKKSLNKNDRSYDTNTT